MDFGFLLLLTDQYAYLYVSTVLELTYKYISINIVSVTIVTFDNIFEPD